VTTGIQPELIPLGPGEVLRHAREQNGWTIDSVSQAIGIKPEVLESIELGDTGHIPSVYLKGHIRNYARYLELDLSAIEQQIHHAKGADPLVQTIFKEGPPRRSGDRWLKAASYVLASVVVSALVWQFTTEAVRFSQGDPMLGTNANGDSVDTHLKASIASGNLESRKTGSGRPSVAEGAWAAITGKTPGPEPMPAGVLNFEVSTSADSWIEIIDGNGQTIEMDLLRAGSKRTYTGVAPVRMLLGRASSVEVFQNGEKISLAPHTRGNVARLTLGDVDAVSTDEDKEGADSEPATDEIPGPG
jgi:cytoskeleton protein RodZ